MGLDTPLMRLQFHLDTIESQSQELEEAREKRGVLVSPSKTIVSQLEQYAA